MFENEGTEIESQSLSDVSQDSSSESQVDSQPVQQEAAPQQQKEVPFHEHPRWKEVMEERNAERQARQTLEQQIASMQRQLQESLKPKTEVQDPMYERLKGIDPEFADYMKSLKDQASLTKQLQEELSGMRQEQFVSSAMAKFEDLNKANGVSPEIANLYFSKLDLGVRTGEIRDLKGLEQAYNALHTSTKKFMEAQERSIIEKYTASKKADASKPAGQAKAKAPSQNAKVDFSKDPAEAKAQLIKHIASNLRAGRDQL